METAIERVHTGIPGWTTFSKAASPKAPESSSQGERAAGRQYAADNTSTKEPQSSANRESTSAPKNHPPNSRRTCYDSAGTSRNSKTRKKSAWSTQSTSASNQRSPSRKASSQYSTTSDQNYQKS